MLGMFQERLRSDGSMQFVNQVFAEPNVYDEFFNALDPEAPLVMINLLKFKEKAK